MQSSLTGVGDFSLMFVKSRCSSAGFYYNPHEHDLAVSRINIPRLHSCMLQKQSLYASSKLGVKKRILGKAVPFIAESDIAGHIWPAEVPIKLHCFLKTNTKSASLALVQI